LTRGEQLMYRYLLKAVGFQPDSVADAISIMRDPELFYDYGTYHHAATILSRWLDVLSTLAYPGQFNGFMLSGRQFNLTSLFDVCDESVITRIVNPFRSYLEHEFRPLLEARPWSLIGLSVNYTSQLPFAIYMCKLSRAVCPDAVICLGGTEVTDI